VFYSYCTNGIAGKEILANFHVWVKRFRLMPTNEDFLLVLKVT
jgi:hypothetical protein